jgi:hypothetical protein
MIRFFGAACVSVLLSGAATAAPVVYDLSGTFTNGSTLTGSFAFDGTKTGADQFSDVSVLVPGYFGWDRVYGNNVGKYDPSDEYVYFYAGRTGDYMRLVFPTTTVAGVTAINGTQLDSTTFAYYYYGNVHLVSGSITEAAAAVPEPATWAMMLLGFGGIGYAMRRKNAVGARIRYA